MKFFVGWAGLTLGLVGCGADSADPGDASTVADAALQDGGTSDAEIGDATTSDDATALEDSGPAATDLGGGADASDALDLGGGGGADASDALDLGGGGGADASDALDLGADAAEVMSDAAVDASSAATWSDVHAEFRSYCTPCHETGGRGGTNLAQSDVMAAYADSQLPSGRCSGETKGACSATRIRNGSMPPSSTIDTEERERIASIIDAWVAAGQPAP